jgi:hypothetical protein
MFFKPPISQHSLIGKFQKWVEMKFNYPTNMENSHTDSFDHFHNIKNFVQVDRRFEISKNRYKIPLFFSAQTHYWQGVLAKTYIINYISLTFYNF